MQDVMEKVAESDVRKRLSFADPVFAEAMDFLSLEVDLLNDNKFVAWSELLTDDMYYTVAGRETLQLSQGSGVTRDNMPAGKRALQALAKRNETEGIYDRDPPPRQRRLLNNVTVKPTDNPDEFEVKTDLLFLHTRQDDHLYAILTAERHDLLRRVNGEMKLARRRLIHDLATLSYPIPNVIL